MGFHPYDNKPLRVTAYEIEAAYATALYIGDMVTLSSGYIVIATEGTGNQLLGAIVGFECINGGIAEGGYYPASSSYNWNALVADHPYQRFVAQDNAGGTLTIANLGGTVNIETATSGNTTTNLSGQEIDSSAVSGAVTDQLRLIGIVDKPGNAWGDNGEYIVEIHNHVLRQENNVDAVT
jgi:hypothetical protein